MGKDSEKKKLGARLVEILYDFIAEIVVAIIMTIAGYLFALYVVLRVEPELLAEPFLYVLLLIPGFLLGLVISIAYRVEMGRGKGTLAETKKRSKRYVRK